MTKLNSIALASSLILGLAAVQPALATFGYENTVANCADSEAGNAVTLEIFTTFTAATADSITAEFIPSFDDSNCTVKMPIGYDTFGGVTVNVTSNIQTSVGAEEIQIVLNDDGSGEYSYTFTDLDPYAEYQFRVDGIYTKSSDQSQYGSVTDNEYYSTSGPAVTDLDIASDGTFSWNNPSSGDEDNIKIDLTAIDDDGNVVMATTRYATSGESYEYYDFRNDFYSGNYVLIATASMKKLYDNVDHRRWGTPVLLSFSTVKGEVVRDSILSNDDVDTSDCLTATAGTSCEVDGDVLPGKPNITKATQTKLKWSAKSGASSYKVKFIGKSGNTLATYKNVTALKLSYTSSKKIAKIKVQACNAFGCGEASKETL